jgi:hypothetical protein
MRCADDRRSHWSEIGIRGRTTAIDFYLLTEAESQFELFTIWKKQAQIAPTISKFIEVLQEAIKAC